jgi:hypothetical protein
MKILEPKVHGVLDYLYAGMFLLAPTLFGFSPLASTLCYIIGASHALVSLATQYPLGVVKVIPFPIHGILEAVASVGILLLPWVAGFTEDVAARNFCVAAGIALFGVWAVTDYQGSKRITDTRTIGVTEDYTYRRTG